MAIYNYKKEEEYQLKSKKDEVTIAIVSGNGQGGSYMVLKDFEFKGSNETVIVGKANTLEKVRFKYSLLFRIN